MTGKRRQKALGESQQQFAYRMNAAVRTVASDFSRFGVRSGLQNGRADSGRFGNGEMSLSIALVPVKLIKSRTYMRSWRAGVIDRRRKLSALKRVKQVRRSQRPSRRTGWESTAPGLSAIVP